MRGSIALTAEFTHSGLGDSDSRNFRVMEQA